MAPGLDNMIRNNFMDGNWAGTSMAAVLTAWILIFSGGAWAAEQSLSFAVGGVVDKILVKPGDAVRLEAPLARLDSRPLRARKRAADARAGLADEVFTRAEKNLSRVKQLYDDLATSGEELEKAQSQLAQAKADREVARARADLAAWRLGRTTLEAPANGTVTQVPGYRGLVVHPRAGNYPVVLFQAIQ